MSESEIEKCNLIDKNMSEEDQVVLKNENIEKDEDKDDVRGDDDVGSEVDIGNFDVNSVTLQIYEGKRAHKNCSSGDHSNSVSSSSSTNCCVNNIKNAINTKYKSSNNNNNNNNFNYNKINSSAINEVVAAAAAVLQRTQPTQDESENETEKLRQHEECIQQENNSNNSDEHLETKIDVNSFKDNFEDNLSVAENGEEIILTEFDGSEQKIPLTERWSPLGADFDEAPSPSESDGFGPESELELLSLSNSPNKTSMMKCDAMEFSRLQTMEDEQELLTTSLLALTSHFAHVQLRVRQIVEAPNSKRDQLLKELEEFAFRGIPGPICPSTLTGISKDDNLEEADESVQERQCELIDHLKSQLSELEKLAYDSGAPVLPQHILLEKQKIIIDELKSKLNLKVEDHDLPQLTHEELKCQVDNAIGEFVGPLKMKDQLVAQLKTQITDLERFIAFLQCDSVDSKMKTLADTNEKFTEAYNSYAAKKKSTASAAATVALESDKSKDTVNTLEPRRTATNQSCDTKSSKITMNAGVRESLNSKAHGLLDKASVLMQMFASTHFGATSEAFQKNTLKKTSKGNHWGDLRAQLEVDIQEVASLAATLNFDREKLKNMKRAMKAAVTPSTSNGNEIISTVQPTRNLHSMAPASFPINPMKTYAISSDSEDDAYNCYDWTRNMRRSRFKGDSITAISRELTIAVRKNFAITLQKLIQHGLRIETSSAASSIIVPFMRCLHPTPVFGSDQNNGRGLLGSSFRSRDYTDFSSVYSPYNGIDEESEDNGGLFGSNGGTRPMHAWELILEYYYYKHGDDYNNTPARKLSESFNLDIVDAQAVTAKQNLLTTINDIVAMHRPYKRSFNAHFKAFICAGLNCHQLVEWLNLIFSCNDIIETYYTSNSYVVRTGFRDSLRSIGTLMKYDFDLPVDLAIRHFKNI